MSEETEELYERLLNLIAEIGWSIAIPDVSDDEEVPGLIIGTEEYVGKVLACLPEDLFRLPN